MDVTFRLDKDILYIAIAGRIDASNAAQAEEKITAEQKEQEKIRFTRKEKRELSRLRKETEGYNPTTGQTSEFGGFAREDTLAKILEVLNTFKSDGVKTTGKAKSEGEEKAPKKRIKHITYSI